MAGAYRAGEARALVDAFGTDAWLRLALFLFILAALAVGEARAPRRARVLSRRSRWPGNLGVLAIGAGLVRLALPVTAVGAGAIAEARGWGLLHAGISLPAWAAVAVSVVILDLAVYLQHVVLHAVPVLWRLHRMHHADLDVDATTGGRFHPIELAVSAVLKLAVVVALGAPAAGVFLFEVLLSASSTFNHANLRLPEGLDRVLRWMLVTPDMHRVHHSVAPAETLRNYGFALSWWDRLGGTYQAQPTAGHEAMTLGIPEFRGPDDSRIAQLLVQPLRTPRRPTGQRPAGAVTFHDPAPPSQHPVRW